MAQNFRMRYPLVQGQGNFGSIDIEDLIAEEDMVVTISREVKEADEEGSGLT